MGLIGVEPVFRPIIVGLPLIDLTPAFISFEGHVLKMYKIETSMTFDANDWTRNHFKVCAARSSAFLISGTPDAHYANCKYGTVGRYVVIEKNHGSYMLVCELEVYTSEIDGR